MSVLFSLSIASGLAGAAAFRGFFPLLIASLTGVISYPPALKWLSSTPILLILLILMAVEFMLSYLPGVSFFHSSLYTALKVVIGGVLFSFTLRINPLVGMVLGGLITFFLIFSRLAIYPWIEGNLYQFRHLEFDTIENLIAITLTILTILLPWLSLIIVGLLIYGTFRISQRIS